MSFKNYLNEEKLVKLQETIFEELTIYDLIFLKENGINYLTEGVNIPYIDSSKLDQNVVEELKKVDLTPEKLELLFREKIDPYYKGESNFGNLYYKGRHSSERTADRNIIENILQIAETLTKFFKDYGKKLTQKYELGNFEIAIEDNIHIQQKDRLHPTIAYDTFRTNNQLKHYIRIITIKPNPFRPNDHVTKEGYIAAVASVPRSLVPQKVKASNGVIYSRDHITFYPNNT